MKKELFSLNSKADGLSLSTAITAPDNIENAKGAIQIVHGMIEHKERYYPLMEWLSGHDYICIINDLRGHGLSVSGPDGLGYMGEGGWQALVDDIKTVGDWAREEFSGLPFTLLGHSMGSLAVRSYLKRYDSTLDLLVVCGSPSDNPAKSAGKMLARAIGGVKGWHHRSSLLQKISFNGYNDAFTGDGFDRAWVCSDKEILKAYHEDPLCSFTFTANGFYNLFGMMQDCYGKDGWNVTKPELSIRFISGGLDPCRISDKDYDKAVESVRSHGYTNVRSRLYPDMRHEILNETGKQAVWNDLLTEMDSCSDTTNR